MATTTEPRTRERPILFSAPMIRALLDGRKSQTRRLMKPQPRWNESLKVWFWDSPRYPEFGNIAGKWTDVCPYGVVGDRLWVREAYTETAFSVPGDNEVVEGHPVYRADAVEDDSGERDGWWFGDRFIAGKILWRSPIHMPRWASRITLEIESIRVERVQDITEADAIAEGSPFRCKEREPEKCRCGGRVARNWFRDRWKEINGPGSWDASPWVWALTFKRV